MSPDERMWTEVCAGVDRAARIVSALLVLGIIAALFVGCSSTNLAEIVKAAGQDPATVCARVTSVYGTVTLLRTNISSGDVSCDTLTVKSTPSTIPVSLQVVPVQR